jgi:hypothetical protein
MKTANVMILSAAIVLTFSSAASAINTVNMSSAARSTQLSLAEEEPATAVEPSSGVDSAPDPTPEPYFSPDP